MRKRIRRSVLLLVVGLFILTGCAAVLVGGAVVGAGTGTYMFINGELKTDYNYNFDKVWSAVEKTVATMRGTDVMPAKGIGTGHIDSVINSEKVRISVTFKEKDITTAAVRVGIVGDETASRMIHANIADNLAKK
jgi:hypothetical protein